MSFIFNIIFINIFLQIASLNFDQNGEITALMSAEGEVVQLTRKINPTSANVN